MDEIKSISSKYDGDFENITEVDSDLYLMSFNSYKMIIGFINTLREPLKTIYGDICLLHK
jgi:hypothetical protein